MNTSSRFAHAGIMLTALLFAAPAYSQDEAEDSPLNQLNWVVGPAVADITNRAEISIPEGFHYLGTDDTLKLMEMMENPSSGDEYYVGREDMRWFAVFSYEDAGYIKDDESIDSSELLNTIRENSEYSNEARRDRGWSEMQVIGWAYEPFYETESNRLAWAVVFESDGEEVVNYNTRILGRTGVMSVTLVGDPETLDQDVAEFRNIMSGFNYKTGSTYAEYREGDKVAAYGLAALVAGGAAAAVVKSGAGKGLFKLLGAGILAFFAFFWSFIKRLFGIKAS